MTAKKNPVVLSPLADPVVGAIFSDAQNAGLAAASLIGAVLEKDGIFIREVVSVTPQRHHKEPGSRGVRIDVEVATEADEVIIVEVQLFPDDSLYQRNLFAASHVFIDRVPEGTQPRDLAASMPRVVAIDLLGYPIRDDNSDYLQPIKLYYTKAPQREAVPQFSIYALQMSRVLEMEPDFEDNLFCWLYVMYRAKQEERTIEEVIAMEPALNRFVNADQGFLQYCKRYHQVAASPKVRDEYYRWRNEQMRQEGMRVSAWRAGEAAGIIAGIAEGRTAGIAEGEAKGRTEAMREAARAMIALGHKPAQVAKSLGIPLADVEAQTF